MYKAITSLWSKPTSSKKGEVQKDVPIDEDAWVFVSDTGILVYIFRYSSIKTVF